MSYVPQRGDLVWLTFDPQAGRRPAVVLTPQTYNEKVGLAVFCPITSRRKGYPFEVEIPDGLEIHGVVLGDQVKSLDWRSRNAELAAHLPAETMAELTGKLWALLGGQG